MADNIAPAPAGPRFPDRSAPPEVRAAELAHAREGAAEDIELAVADDRSAEERIEMPLPRDPRSWFQAGLFLLAMLAALYVARDFVLPIVLAVVLKLLLQPFVRLLERARVPRAAGALLAIGLLLGLLVGLGMLLSGQASDWLGKLPDELPRLEQTFARLKEPLDRLQSTLFQMGLTSGLQKTDLSQIHPAAWLTAVFSGTGTVASGLLMTILILFYLLVFGETFMRRTVEILPRFRDKREAVEISLHIERDLSAYLLTITVINAVVGTATAGVMWATGMPSPPLWGVFAFCLNFVPILGPIAGIVIFLVLGVLVKGPVWGAMLPAGLYLCIHLTEGEIVTPMLLARRFTINPVAVILSLTFWFFMWGVPGAILAVPMLAIVKIICDRLRPLRAFGHFLEG